MSTSARVRQHVRSNVVGYVALAMCLTMAPAFAASVTAPKNSVTSKSIKNGQVKSADLAASSVGTTAIVNGTIGSADVNSGQVQLRVNASCSAGSSISAISATGAVSCETDDEGSGAPSGPASGDLAGTYPNPTIGSGAVTSAKILDSTIAGADILNGSVTGTDLADATVTTANVVDGTVTAAKLANNAVTAAKIVDGTIATADLADSSVTGAKVADLSLGGTDIAENTVHANRIIDNTIGSNKLQDNTVLGVDVDESTLDYSAIQKRVTETCAVGSAITAIYADGSVECGPELSGRAMKFTTQVPHQEFVTIAGLGSLKVYCNPTGAMSLILYNSSPASLNSAAATFMNQTGSFGGAQETYFHIGRTVAPATNALVVQTPGTTAPWWDSKLTIWPQMAAVGESTPIVANFQIAGQQLASTCEVAISGAVTF